MKKGYVVIVTYNGIKWIDECLNSVFNSSFLVTPIVIDNNSTDGTSFYIQKNFPDVVFFKQNENLGFGQANNIGLTYALKKEADFVFLLNQDAFLEKNTIANLIKVALEYPHYGVLSPIQLDYSGKLLEKYFFNFSSKNKTNAFYSDFVINNKIKDIYPVNFIQAAAWFLPIKTLEKIGGFDPIFFHYGEDDNYCQRVHYHKLRIGIVPNTFIRHDSNKVPENNYKIFSKKYFSVYKKDVYIYYANINGTLEHSTILKVRKKNYKKIIKSILKFNLKYTFGYFKELKIFNNCMKAIKLSREINKIARANYLK